MTRIIAGRAGGRTLRTPRGSATRPTSDRVREALFSALDARGAVQGASVLDLYAGSGALGLEALSRGAQRAVLVESDRRTAALIATNARELGLADATVLTRSVLEVLRGEPDAAYDLALLDPPYPLAETELSQALAALTPWLAPEAVVVVERSGRSPEPTWPPSWQAERQRRYGETTLWVAVAPGQGA